MSNYNIVYYNYYLLFTDVQNNNNNNNLAVVVVGNDVGLEWFENWHDVDCDWVTTVYYYCLFLRKGEVRRDR